ncbi:MAG: dicarboxylate/amino acid:cation symporter [Phycisphaerae bacterium]|nr:dicarboxylate/amino acid:cation symporter [Phycisphaerae bacterium]
MAVLLGILTGYLLGEHAKHLQIVGDLFIRLLKMIIIPLIFATMVSGVVSTGQFGRLGRIGAQTFTYYLITTVLAITVGLVLVNIIAPGIGANPLTEQVFSPTDHQPPTVTSILYDIVPANIFKAMAQGDVLPVIFFSLLLGAALLGVRDKAEPVIVFFKGFDAVMMKLTDWIMRLAPIGVFALIAVMVSRLNKDDIFALAKYMLTVIAGLAVHACIVLPILLRIFAKRNPLTFFRQMFNALVTAFSTDSSAATLPVSMECLEQNAKLPERITSFVMPIGATVNMDGTALYEAVAVMFIAQAYGVEMTFANQVVIALTATLASIGAAAIPSAGLITMVIVLRAVNLPLEGIGMILAVDRILDMCRTTVNVWGDACGAAIIAKLDEKN